MPKFVRSPTGSKALEPHDTDGPWVNSPVNLASVSELRTHIVDKKHGEGTYPSIKFQLANYDGFTSWLFETAEERDKVLKVLASYSWLPSYFIHLLFKIKLKD